MGREKELAKRGPGRPRIENKREKKEGLYGFRTDASEKELIDSAVKISGEGPSDFAKKATLDRAKRVIKKRAAE